MTDETVGRPAGSPARRTVRGSVRALLPYFSVTPHMAAALAGVLFAAASVHFCRTEGTPLNVLFTIGVTAVLIAVLALVTRRLLFATTVVLGICAIVSVTASIKRQIMSMVVHAYDLIFYLGSWSTISYLWADHRRYLVGFLLAVAALVSIGAWIYRHDPTRLSRTVAAGLLAVSLIVATAGARLKEERRHMQFNFENLYVSSFFASFSETAETLWRGGLVEAATSANGPLLTLPSNCTTDRPSGNRKPHIVLIHQESVVPPSLFPTLAYDKSVDPLFTSADGKLHKMRVETYGGASWLTEFSLLTGLSTQSFGGMRQFVQTVMHGRVRDTLPEALQRCGYRNVVFYPMLRNFVSNTKFYNSIGLPEVFDLKDQKATRANERDRFYYTNALAEMERHVKGTQQPLFTYIQTMAAHWPYDITYDEHEKVPGGGPGTDPEMNEYLRRVAMAKMDYDWLKSELARRFPGQPILIVHYGDHQPTATRTLLGFGANAEAEDVVAPIDSPAYMTYYAVDALNWQVPQLPDLEAVDVAYLGGIVLEAAKLPLSPAFAERKRLMAVCGGHYYGCKRRGEVLAFHRRLIDSRLMDAR
jgi:phosphoglycerol transferase MdoB-like AlkP superfamily enzyme